MRASLHAGRSCLKRFFIEELRGDFNGFRVYLPFFSSLVTPPLIISFHEIGFVEQEIVAVEFSKIFSLLSRNSFMANGI